MSYSPSLFPSLTLSLHPFSVHILACVYSFPMSYSPSLFPSLPLSSPNVLLSLSLSFSHSLSCVYVAAKHCVLLVRDGVTICLFCVSTWMLFTAMLLAFKIISPLSPSLPPSLVSSPAAEPTPEEGEVHRKVATVLDRAPDILADLHGYKGAGEHIREVGNCHLSLEEGISYLLHVNARSCIH